MEAAKRDAQLEQMTRQLTMEQQQSRQQLLDAVDMVRLQRSNYKRSAKDMVCVCICVSVSISLKCAKQRSA